MLLCSWQTLSTAKQQQRCTPVCLQVSLLLDALRATRPSSGPAGMQLDMSAMPIESPLLSCPPTTSHPAAASGHKTMTCGVLHSAGLQTSTAAMLDEVLLQGGSKRHTPRVALFHTPALRGLLKRWATVIEAAAQLSRTLSFCGFARHVWEQSESG